MTPVHTVGVRTPEEYEARQRKEIAKGRQLLPALNWRDPWLSPDRLEAVISGGRWLVKCTTEGCANAPLTHPEWQVARCFECGAVYEAVIFPDAVDAIAAILVQRPSVHTRNWRPGETLDQLTAENTAHGIAP